MRILVHCRDGKRRAVRARAVKGTTLCVQPYVLDFADDRIFLDRETFVIAHVPTGLSFTGAQFTDSKHAERFARAVWRLLGKALLCKTAKGVARRLARPLSWAEIQPLIEETKS